MMSVQLPAGLGAIYLPGVAAGLELRADGAQIFLDPGTAVALNGYAAVVTDRMPVDVAASMQLYGTNVVDVALVAAQPAETSISVGPGGSVDPVDLEIGKVLLGSVTDVGGGTYVVDRSRVVYSGLRANRLFQVDSETSETSSAWMELDQSGDRPTIRLPADSGKPCIEVDTNRMTVPGLLRLTGGNDRAGVLNMARSAARERNDPSISRIGNTIRIQLDSETKLEIGSMDDAGQFVPSFSVSNDRVKIAGDLTIDGNLIPVGGSQPIPVSPEADRFLEGFRRLGESGGDGADATLFDDLLDLINKLALNNPQRLQAIALKFCSSPINGSSSTDSL